MDKLSDVVRAKSQSVFPVVFSREEVQQVFKYLSGDKLLIAKLMYGTGMRVSEAIDLRIQDIDFGQNEIIIKRGKGGIILMKA